jgi:hypothetical protein
MKGKKLCIKEKQYYKDKTHIHNRRKLCRTSKDYNNTKILHAHTINYFMGSQGNKSKSLIVTRKTISSTTSLHYGTLKLYKLYYYCSTALCGP